MGFISGMQECLNIQKSANIMDHTKNIEEINNQLSSYRVTAQQNSSIHLCDKYLLSSYYYIPDLMLITKDKISKQNRQHIWPHGAYCPRITV